jgi:hypothetical protein
MHKNKLVLFQLISIFILNQVDSLFTMWAIKAKVATELNPIMAWLISINWPTFLIGKFLLVVVLLAMLWFLRQARHATKVYWVAVSCYVALVIYELIGYVVITNRL